MSTMEFKLCFCLSSRPDELKGFFMIDRTPCSFLFTGLCWGQNAQVHGKEKFPYAEAALR